MSDLVAFCMESGVELGDILVDVRFVLRDSVDDLVIRAEGFRSDLRDLSGDGGGEKECLALLGQGVDNEIEVVREPHLQEGIRFVQDENVGILHNLSHRGLAQKVL